MTNLGLFFWQICQKHIPNREKGVQENPQAFLYPENKTIFSALHPYPLRGAGDRSQQQFPRRGLLFSLHSAPALLFLNYIYRKV